jgi:hypothetical protein
MPISCGISTNTHCLETAAFRLLQLEESNLRVHNVSADRFELFVRALDNFDANPGASFHHSHQVIRSFLVALNVSSFGCFYWGPMSHGCTRPCINLRALVAPFEDSPHSSQGQRSRTLTSGTLRPKRFKMRSSFLVYSPERRRCTWSRSTRRVFCYCEWASASLHSAARRFFVSTGLWRISSRVEY